MGYAGMKFKPRTFQSTFLAVLLAWAVGGMTIAHADVSEKAEVDAVHHATTPPVGAVSRAEAKFGGKAFDMGLEVSTSGTWYEVPLNVRGKPMLARINPSSGAWLGMSPAHGEDVQGLHVSVAAQRAGLGRALEAGPHGHGTMAYYDIDVIRTNGSMANLEVNPNSGAVSDAPVSEAD